MSWNFQLQKINQSFERIASWYFEFMHRTELCFRALHERIMSLEERQALEGPSDEQVERVLRKILAEKFSYVGKEQFERSAGVKEEAYFVEHLRYRSIPVPVAVDPASLFVDPEDVPSKQYAETFRMLESRLEDYPCFDEEESTHSRETDAKIKFEVKTPNAVSGA
ncbi:hypothetical protein FB567DRAFT_132658 [Paraphoma chrysanthemicola]|uniref:Uncharacterized protein n=1 Tax=Paraphoma chrysanthemicola TaxID=798071 RepID=A0A8K0QYU7_9PLEO|nr:hypothetical protein FB567DRAFT_132658 [Paraphoma chrysanthemicola]